jgi:hypothetical protein
MAISRSGKGLEGAWVVPVRAGALTVIVCVAFALCPAGSETVTTMAYAPVTVGWHSKDAESADEQPGGNPR